MGNFSLPLQVNGMTDDERRELLLWMATARPSTLRAILRDRHAEQSRGVWVKSSHAKCPDPPEGCGAYTEQWEGKGEARLRHGENCPLAD